MNKNWQVFLIHLCVQIIAAVIIVKQTPLGSDGHFRGLAALFRLIVMAGSFVGISLLALAFLFVNKESRKGILYSILVCGILLLFSPIIIEKCEYVLWKIESRKRSRALKEAYKKINLEVAKQMGLSSYTLNPTTNQIAVKTKDGKQQTFYVRDWRLIIHTNIQPPASTDTLAWLKLSLEEASAYLNSWEYKVLDSCIQVRSYEFRSNNFKPYVNLHITLHNMGNRVTNLQGEFMSEPLGNYRITLNLYGIRHLPEKMRNQ